MKSIRCKRMLKIIEIHNGDGLVKWDTVLSSPECPCFSPATETLTIFSVLKPDINKLLVKTTP